MTSVQMVEMFYDVLENTNPVFSNTRLRPISEVVLSYLNSAQITFFNQRYLPGDTLTNINTIRALKHELQNLLESNVYVVNTTSRDYQYVIEGVEGHFVEALIEMSHSLLSKNVLDRGWSEVIPVVDNTQGKFLTNHINHPILLQPVIVVSSDVEVVDNSFTLITDSFTTFGKESDSVTKPPIFNKEITIVTLYTPPEIELAVNDESAGMCYLDERYHSDIVRLAVESYLRDKGAFANQEREEA